jgi:hypothetical protein
MGWQLASTPPARVAHEALQFFCDDLLKDMPVQGQVSHQALQLRVLHRATVAAPAIPTPHTSSSTGKTSLADSMLTADLDHRPPNTRRISSSPFPRFTISKLSSLVPENHGRLRSLNFTRLSFLVLGQPLNTHSGINNLKEPSLHKLSLQASIAVWADLVFFGWPSTS